MNLLCRLAAFLSLVLCACASFPTAKPTEVLVVASMHGFHAHHPSYDYDKLYALVAAARPEIVGLEIRPEDIGEDGTYLAKNYPREMIVLRDQYRHLVTGFDWLGDELSDRPIPDDWWSNQSITKQLERKMGSDSTMTDPAMEALSNLQTEILRAATATSLVDGRYHRLVREMRERIARRVGSGPYLTVVRFTNDREQHIGDRLIKLVRANPGKKIVIIIGADHHGYAVERLKSTFGSRVFVTVPS